MCYKRSCDSNIQQKKQNNSMEAKFDMSLKSYDTGRYVCFPVITRLMSVSIILVCNFTLVSRPTK